jgi:osmotically inducible protein OsmC
MAARRTAEVTWQGDLLEGTGSVRMVSSGMFDEYPVTWASRADDPNGGTSPEELMAAAHAACLAMALSHHLAGKNTPPERLTVSATYTFVPGTGITAADLDVTGVVRGLSAGQFEAEAREGESKCPVSNAVRGNVEITLSTSLG